MENPDNNNEANRELQSKLDQLEQLVHHDFDELERQIVDIDTQLNQDRETECVLNASLNSLENELAEAKLVRDNEQAKRLEIEEQFKQLEDEEKRLELELKNCGVGDDELNDLEDDEDDDGDEEAGQEVEGAKSLARTMSGEGQQFNWTYPKVAIKEEKLNGKK